MIRVVLLNFVSPVPLLYSWSSWFFALLNGPVILSSSGCRADGSEAAIVLLPSNITVFTLDFSGSGLSGGEHVTLGWNEVCASLIILVYLFYSSKSIFFGVNMFVQIYFSFLTHVNQYGCAIVYRGTLLSSWWRHIWFDLEAIETLVHV